VVFGDSHAAQWFPALEDVAEEEGWRLVPLIKGSCPTSSTPIFNVDLRREYRECEAWRQDAFTRIHEIDPVAVVMANATNLYVGSARWQVRPDDWAAGVERSLQRMADADILTVVIPDTPLPGFDVPSCLSRRQAERLFHDDCTFRLDDAVNAEGFTADRDATADVALAYFMDLNPLVCASPTCDVKHDGVVIYKDEGHLSVAFVEHTADEFGDALSTGLREHGRAD
jgi:hypothetical protein